MSTIMERVAGNVKRLRTERGLSQQALADKAKIHRVYLAYIETGSRAPSLEILERLAKALKVKAAKLVE
ncbi:MAG: helix-turn-helix transcriptional regulator [Candidatus Methylomirabilota bacterium]